MFEPLLFFSLKIICDGYEIYKTSKVMRMMVYCAVNNSNNSKKFQSLTLLRAGKWFNAGMHASAWSVIERLMVCASFVPFALIHV